MPTNSSQEPSYATGQEDIRLVRRTVKMMRANGAEERQVPGYEEGFTVPAPATMSFRYWCGIVELTADNSSIPEGAPCFFRADSNAIRVEYAHWLGVSERERAD